MEAFFADGTDSAHAPLSHEAEEKPVDKEVSVDASAVDDSEVESESGDEGDSYEVEGFGNYGSSFSLMEFVKRLLKYLVEGLVVAIAASTIPKKSLDLQEVGVIALSAAATFALLDLFAPTISYAARQGAGFGVGANLVGFPRL